MALLRLFSPLIVNALFITGLTLCTKEVNADLPTGEIIVSYVPTSPSVTTSTYRTMITENEDKEILMFLATQASFGVYPPQEKIGIEEQNYPFTFKPVFSPDIDPLLCNTNEEMENFDENDIPSFDPTMVMIVPRGSCTFEQKALNAQVRYNVGGIVIYGSLFSRYGYNETSEEVIWPKDKYDYDCTYGEGSIDINELEFDPGYEPSNDELLQDKCEANENGRMCSSHKCLLTGPPSESGLSQICCAWDLNIWLYSDSSIPANTTDTTVIIPAMYITMNQFDKLEKVMKNGHDVELSMYARNRPKYNASGILVWALGVFTVAIASYLSSMEIRQYMKHYQSHEIEDTERILDEANLESTNVNRQSDRLRSRSPRPISDRNQPTENSVVMSSHANAHVSRQEQIREEDQDSLEITLIHALVFVVWSSFSLFILFYFEIYNVVKVMYAIGCAGAFSQVMVNPFYNFLFRKRFDVDGILFSTNFLDIGNISCLDLSSTVTGYTLGIVWLILAFTQNNPQEIAFFWIMQDLMGMSICIIFLSILKVNTLKVATVLLSVAFFYDIFFVFITPFLFSGKSIMVTVATSGGPPTADPLWCEKYPSDKDCQGGDPLPMLLTIPRLFDYQGGSSLLGLGDIVLPGLVLSFASRLDEAQKLVASTSGGRVEGRTREESKKIFGGYFGLSVVAYAIGLFMANLAVHIMKMGQPALLYLVPLCLGAIFYKGWKKGEISDLWNGPRALKLSEQIMKSRSSHFRNEDDAISLQRVPNENTSINNENNFTNIVA